MKPLLRTSTPQENPRDAVRDALTQEFSREVEAQRDQIPRAHLILLVAQLEARIRRRSRIDVLVGWIRPLMLSSVAGLLAFWWNRVATAPIGLAVVTEPWIQAIALAALLFAMAFGWTRILLRTG
jgi:AcrR family transcriptional regulator